MTKAAYVSAQRVFWIIASDWQHDGRDEPRPSAPDGGWGLYPADGLRGHGEIVGRSVRCTTPDLQLRHHLGYRLADRDRHDLRLLAKRVGLPFPPHLSDG
jgi:hypothetical protein